ncbi:MULTISPECIES: hypothetical protein [unclassified Granulicatella]|uniref:hypothetical protein n=1 Tax=unclassified Granulicatella TaxID=2630493 RepID=UPI001073E494|nr:MULTISPECIES: hypothetical protein [unclassified Granulicatella]MBF0781072.1 hypothetical protein [Granulicatella sp. 19428wC4_WM01]TFU92245.1 hypothetical protein E4T68_08145 [Granulicatella sp. WM01]
MMILLIILAALVVFYLLKIYILFERAKKLELDFSGAKFTYWLIPILLIWIIIETLFDKKSNKRFKRVIFMFLNFNTCMDIGMIIYNVAYKKGELVSKKQQHDIYLNRIKKNVNEKMKLA